MPSIWTQIGLIYTLISTNMGPLKRENPNCMAGIRIQNSPGSGNLPLCSNGVRKFWWEFGRYFWLIELTPRLLIYRSLPPPSSRACHMWLMTELPNIGAKWPWELVFVISNRDVFDWRGSRGFSSERFSSDITPKNRGVRNGGPLPKDPPIPIWSRSDRWI